MIKHLLLDLDDTLLQNNMDGFIPAYFKSLSSHMAARVDPSLLIKELKAGTHAMISKTHPEKTLEEVFDDAFYPGLGLTKESIRQEIDAFYAEKFPLLQTLTAPVDGAVAMVKTALSKGLQVSIATNPLFPRTAILQRLCWANLSPTEFPFLLIPSFETFHFAKPNYQFYVEFLENINASPDECVMVGNDFEADILPASQIGITTYHVSDGSINACLGISNYHSGTIVQLEEWIQQF